MAFHVKRIYFLRVVFFLCCILLIGRLFCLQLVEGPRLAVQGLSSRIQEVPMEVARGEILDRNGLPLTNTAQNFSVAVFPAQIKDKELIASQLAVATVTGKQDIIARLHSDNRPFKVKTDIDAITAQKINSLAAPGVVVVAERMRYGNNSLAAHVLGYINHADNKGVSGIEGRYDEELRGRQPTYLAALVDASQRLIPGLGYKKVQLTDGTEPCDVVLTLDSRIQKIVENVLDRNIKKGTVVVMRPSTGEILAMASRPTFDANNLSEYLSRDTAPLLNRAVSAYQPGSVYKLVVAAAALETAIVHPGDSFYDKGYIDVNNLRFKGWDYEKGGRGHITFTEAMAFSSNPVFIEVGLKLGAGKLIDYSKRLGFGQRSSLNLDGESEGNLPEPDTLYPGDIANLSIGQGSLEATPLQVALMVATIVNDGIKVEPYLVDRLVKPDGTIVKKYYVSRGERVLSKMTAGWLKEMMEAVTRYGTGQAAFVEKYGAAGKTGSAETGRTEKNGKSINHAWFAGYAPIVTPKYAVVVLVEEGMSGGDVAAPIFHDIVKEILSL